MGFYNADGEYEDRELEKIETIVTCKYCEQKYKQIQEEQIAGFRDRSYDTCPYCGLDNGTSMEYDYYNIKITETA